MLVDAAVNPTENVKNIYFGFIMGISSAIPTVLHLSLFVQSAVFAFGKRIVSPVTERSKLG